MDHGKGIFYGSIVVAVALLAGFYLHGMASRPQEGAQVAGRVQESAMSVQRSGPTKGAIDFEEAPKHIGETATVRGKILKVGHSQKSNTYFLNFCYDYRSCPFVAVIFSSAVARFPDPFQFEGKTVEISGKIQEYKGSAEIILNDPSQMKVLD